MCFMIRHISVFTFNSQCPNGKSKAENIAAVRAFMEQNIPALYPPIRVQYVYTSAMDTPELPDEAPVMFGDLIQIIDFDTAEDAAGYAPSEAHTKLVEFSGAMLNKVTAIDFEV